MSTPPEHDQPDSASAPTRPDPTPADGSPLDQPAAAQPEPTEEPRPQPEPEPDRTAEPPATPADEAQADPRAEELADLASASAVPAPADTPADPTPTPTDPAEPPADSGAEAAEEVAELSDTELANVVEALLLVVDSPVEEEALADATGTTVARVGAALRALAATYTDGQRGIDLRHAGGGWRFYTRDRYAPYVEKLLLGGQRAKLTRAALETLAVIAYRQPVTRARVAAVRGVNCDGVIRTLLARGLVEETGTDTETGGFLYRTTELFLERLGLSSLEDLPPIAPLLPEVDSIDDI